MGAQRFVEVPPPLEERVGEGLLTRLRYAVAFGVDAKNRFNQSMNDDELKARATDAIVDAMRPGTVPFLLLTSMLIVIAIHQWTLHRETQRILREHGALGHQSLENDEAFTEHSKTK